VNIKSIQMQQKKGYANGRLKDEKNRMCRRRQTESEGKSRDGFLTAQAEQPGPG
jgi:hypothetical protein